ncbi:MAG: ABC transporter permease [Christensenellaceae bacterium]|nr:ABC transporter permease [Christensenellaceae bacterium]
MLHIIFQDIKSILKKPFLIILLFLGLLVGVFSMLTVYTMNSSSKVLSDTGFSKDRIIQFNSFFPDDEAEKVFSVILYNAPEVEYISAISYQFPNYDVVGIYNTREDISGNYYGDAITSDDMGQYSAMISEDLFENAPENGESFPFSGKTFTVKGRFYQGDAGYDAVGFDLRRLPEGAEYVAGMDFSLERDEIVSARENKAIVMPYDIFTELNYEPNAYTVFFAEPLTEEMRTEIQNSITEATGIEDFLDLGSFDTVLSKNQWSRSAIYFAAVIAGIINIVTLYAFIIEQNKRIYRCYRLLGAKNRTVIRLICSEVFIVTLIAYIAGALLSAAFIQNTELSTSYVLPNLLEYILVFILIYFAEICISIGKIRNIIGIPPKRKKVDQPKLRMLHSKFFYLLRHQYKRKNAAGVFSIVLLSFIVSLVFSYAMTYVFEQSAFERYVSANTVSEVITVNPSDAHYESFSDHFIHEEIPYQKNPEHIDFLNRLTSLEGITVGIQHERIHVKNENCDITTFDKEYLRNIRLPLKKGSYQKLLEYDMSDEDAPIPCLVSEETAKEHPYGSIFAKKLMFNTDAQILSADDESRTVQFVWDEPEREFLVAGVYADNAMMTNGYGYFNVAVADITMYLGSIEKRLILAPEFLHNGKLCYETEEPGYFLFTEKGNEDALIKAKESLSGAADLHSFSACLDAYMESYKTGGGNLYFIYAIIGALLLLLGSGTFLIIQFSSNLRTYGIYFTCGMPWRTAHKLSLISSALNMIPSSLLGAVSGIIFAIRIRGQFFEDTLLLSFFAGAVLVFFIYVIVSVANIFLIKGKYPRTIFGEAQE